MQGCDVTALRGFLVYRFPANFSSPWVDVHLVTFAMRCTHSGTKLPRAVDGRLPAMGWAPLGTNPVRELRTYHRGERWGRGDRSTSTTEPSTRMKITTTSNIATRLGIKNRTRSIIAAITPSPEGLPLKHASTIDVGRLPRCALLVKKLNRMCNTHLGGLVSGVVQVVQKFPVIPSMQIIPERRVKNRAKLYNFNTVEKSQFHSIVVPQEMLLTSGISPKVREPTSWN